MPPRALRHCSSPGCRVLVQGGKCPRHQAQADAQEAKRKAAYEARRPPRSVPTWDPRWKALRAAHLAAHPICVGFGSSRERCSSRATIADHVVPERVAPERALDPGNIEGLCASCHGRKTAARDTAFGNPRR
jgi:5-methylcytosine-specific restriction protein A